MKRLLALVLVIGLAVTLAACSQGPTPPSWTTAYTQGFEGSSMPLAVTDVSIGPSSCTQQPTLSDASLALVPGGASSSRAAALSVNTQGTGGLYMKANVWHKLTSLASLTSKRDYRLSADFMVDKGAELQVIDLGFYMASGSANGSHGYWGAMQWLVNPYGPSSTLGQVRIVYDGNYKILTTIAPDSAWHHVTITFGYDPNAGLTITSAAVDGTSYAVNKPAVVSVDSSTDPFAGFAFDALNAYTNCDTANHFQGTSYWDNLTVQTRAAQ